mmetsp:Transcript_51885/g.121367  ORF Transcript_51885/g.121367 Transcript_51885/m.121367 type:complete len:262 (+) Transcript_51885:4835-5620(+)
MPCRSNVCATQLADSMAAVAGILASIASPDLPTKVLTEAPKSGSPLWYPSGCIFCCSGINLSNGNKQCLAGGRSLTAKYASTDTRFPTAVTAKKEKVNVIVLKGSKIVVRGLTVKGQSSMPSSSCLRGLNLCTAAMMSSVRRLNAEWGNRFSDKSVFGSSTKCHDKVMGKKPPFEITISCELLHPACVPGCNQFSCQGMSIQGECGGSCIGAGSGAGSVGHPNSSSLTASVSATRVSGVSSPLSPSMNMLYLCCATSEASK